MHKPINDFDLAAVTNLVTGLKSEGWNADYDVSRRNEGILTVTSENWNSKDKSLIIYEIHKVAKKGLFKDKVSWIVQLYAQEDDSVPLTKKGCSSGKTQQLALHEAAVDVKWNFMSVCDFDLAYADAME